MKIETIEGRLGEKLDVPFLGVRLPLKKVYLATPYTHQDDAVKRARFEAVTVKAAELIREHGVNVFSPITHSFNVECHGDLPCEWEFWQEIDRQYIEDWADEVWVLKQEGWERSVGVLAEIEIASAAGKPVVFLEM